METLMATSLKQSEEHVPCEHFPLYDDAPNKEPKPEVVMRLSAAWSSQHRQKLCAFSFLWFLAIASGLWSPPIIGLLPAPLPVQKWHQTVAEFHSAHF